MLRRSAASKVTVAAGASIGERAPLLPEARTQVLGDRVLGSSGTFGVDARSALVILGVAAYYSYIAISNVATWRSSGLSATLTEIAIWAIGAFLISARRSGLRLRISDPGVIFLGWALYFYIDPATRWVTGDIRYYSQFDSIVTPEQFVRVQHLQSAFILAYMIAYRFVAPAVSFTVESRERVLQQLPRVHWLVLVGLLPFVWELGRRVVTGGTIAPVNSYGENMYDLSVELEGAGRTGGPQLVILQSLLRLAIVPIMALGTAFGVFFASMLRERRWIALLLTHLAFPALLYFGQGARSNIMSIYLIAIIIADVLAGPVPWTYLLGVVLLGGALSSGFALYRVYQHEGFETAVGNTIAGFGREEYTSGDGAIMIVKEAFIVNVVDRSGATQGPEYFVEQAASLLPRQLVPEKASWFRVGDFLSHEFLGAEASHGSGVAGAMVGDGYWLGRDVGVVTLAVVLATIVGTLTRVCSRGRRGQPVAFWWLTLLAAFMSRTFFVLRGDFGIVLSEILWDVAVPAILLGLLAARYPASPWLAPLVARSD